MNTSLSPLQGKRVLVTGGTGFIGRFFASSLVERGASVICLTRRDQELKEGVIYKQCDIRNISVDEGERLRKEIGIVDYIVYLAASIPLVSSGKESIIQAKENNLDAMLRFLEAFGDLAPVLVFASTVDVYGVPVQENFDESQSIAPRSTYAVAKYCCEKYFEYYCTVHNKQYNILRLSQVYGPREPLVRVIPIIVDAVLNKKEFTLKGTGEDKRRFIYVADAARALIAAMESPHNAVYNIAGMEDVSIMEVIYVIEKITGEKLRYTQVLTDQQPVHILPSCSKALVELNFTPLYSFESGMKAVLKDAYENT